MPQITKKIKKQLLFMLLPAFAVLVAAVVAHYILGIAIIQMTRDVATLGNLHPFSGFISSLGILLWTATTSVCIFTATIIGFKSNDEHFYFIGTAGLITAYLLFDDLFLFHEFLESWFNNGEKIVYAALAIAVTIWILRFKKAILLTDYYILIMALLFLSLSVIVDTIQPFFWEKGNIHALAEDGFKWIGIVCWFSYFWVTSLLFIKNLKANGIKN